MVQAKQHPNTKKEHKTMVVYEKPHGEAKRIKKEKKQIERKAAHTAISAVENKIAKRNEREGKVHNLESLDRVLQSFAAPSSYPPVRISSDFCAYKTAIANPWYKKTAYFGDLANGGNIIDTVAYAFRDQCRSLIYLADCAPGYRYSSQSFTLNVTQVPTPLRVPCLVYDTAYVNQARPHGDVLYPGLDGSNNSRSYFWGQGGDQFNFINGTGTSVTIQQYRFDPVSGYAVNVGPLGPIASGASTNVSVSSVVGYWGWDIVGAAVSTGNFQVQITRATAAPGVKQAVWAHLALPYATQNLPSVDAAKIYGVSLMYSNRAAPLNRQGKIAGCQLPAGTQWWNYQTYSTVSSLNDATSMNADNGLYGFLKSTQPADYNFKDQDRYDASVFPDSFFMLSPESDYLVISAQVTTAAGQDGEWTAGYALEYRTTDQWRTTDISRIPINTVQFAVGMLSRMPQWHENPLHLSDIGNWISDRANGAWNWIKEALPTVVSVGSTAAKIAGALIPLM